MLRVGGHVTIIGPDGVTERDTLKCVHCQRIVEVKPGSWGQVYLIPDARQATGYREEAGAFCRRCMGPICLPCNTRGKCEHWERGLDRLERRSRGG